MGVLQQVEKNPKGLGFESQNTALRRELKLALVNFELGKVIDH